MGRRRIKRASIQSKLTQNFSIPKPKVGKVERLSPKTYRRTSKQILPVTVRNRTILEMAKKGVTEKDVCDDLHLSSQTARIELKYLEKLGLLK